jgi:hypothetical protein
VISKVREWLEQSGFALELRVASALREANFDVLQSSYYLDPDSGKGREIDAVAIDPDPLGVLDIRFMVECKSSDKPWVLLASSDTAIGYNPLTAYALMSASLRKAMIDQVMEFSDRLPWFKKDGPIAYQARQAWSEADAAYAAAMSVAKASTTWLAPSEGGRIASFIAVFPVIVVDAPLLQCSLAPDGSIDVCEVDEGEWLFTARLPAYFGTCIRVVTLQRLPAFAREAKRAADSLRALMTGPIEEVVASWQRS